jgi:hypothetical protein
MWRRVNSQGQGQGQDLDMAIYMSDVEARRVEATNLLEGIYASLSRVAPLPQQLAIPILVGEGLARGHVLLDQWASA